MSHFYNRFQKRRYCPGFILGEDSFGKRMMKSADGVGRSLTSGRRMLKHFLTFTAIALLFGPLFAFQQPESVSAAASALTDEEREILKDREMLEHLDLLRDFEKFRFFYFFAEAAAPDKTGEMAKVQTKETKKSEKKKNEKP